MRQSAKRDANEPAIVAALLDCGCRVERISQKGVPDLLVWTPWLQCFVLLEVKDGDRVRSGRALTADQVEWHAQWSAASSRIHVVETVRAALAAVGAPTIRKKVVVR